MNKVIIFGGTTEGRQLAESLAAVSIDSIYCVATEYGKQPVEESKYIQIKTGRMDNKDMLGLFNEISPDAIIDATHPFAEIVKTEIDTAIFQYKDVPFFRISRKEAEVDYSNCTFFDSVKECVQALEKTDGTIFLTTGSKEIAEFCKNESLRERIIARVIPSQESLKICSDNGLKGNQIIAMQGPFSAGMNLSFLRECDARIMVLKEGGSVSGEAERIIAANKAKVKCFIIKRPQKPVEGLSLYQVRERLFELFKIDPSNIDLMKNSSNKILVTLAGFGMGFGSITAEVQETINEADYIFGAPRMIVGIETNSKKYPLYKAKDVADKLREIGEIPGFRDKKVVVLFSGDTGFYSGASKLLEEIKNDSLFKVKVLPGISSVNALASKINETWQDASILSTHGIKPEIWLPKVLDSSIYNSKTFIITSGSKDIRLIGENLVQLENIFSLKFLIFVGVNLYSDEKIIQLNPQSCSNFNEDGLCTVFIKNIANEKRSLTPDLSDESFIRDKVPMSKEEIRMISICKLGLKEDSVCYDIGSGSGSVAVSIGRLNPKVRVYAIELKQEACQLIEKNIDKFALKNVELISGTAPEVLESLPVPTHVFIGGSGGRLEDILDTLISYNNNIKVVINAVTIETICEINSCLKKYKITDAEIVQITVSKGKKAGDYNVMQGQNPVYIVTFSV